MKIRLILTILLCSFITGTFAQKAKPGTGFAQVTKAARHTATADDPIVYHTIKATWKTNSTPESIFFRSGDTWKNCIVLKNGKEIAPEAIRKADKLTFKTIDGGRFAIPDEIQAITPPALFFRVNGIWYYLPVKNITGLVTPK